MTKLSRRAVALLAALTVSVSLTACGSSDTSKADVTAGLEKLFVSQRAQFPAELSEDNLRDIAKCIADTAYDKVAPSTRATLAKGEDVKSGKDGKTLFDAGRDCAMKVVTESLSAPK